MSRRPALDLDGIQLYGSVASGVRTHTLAELYEVHDADLSCGQVQRLAYWTVERMGYRVTPTELAADEKPGAILAEQRRGRASCVGAGDGDV